VDVRPVSFAVAGLLCGALFFSIRPAQDNAVRETAAVPSQSRSASAYELYGCRVYTANDWFTTDLTAGGSRYARNSVDPRSAAILSNFAAVLSNPVFNINGTDASVPQNPLVNRVTSRVPLHPVRGLAWGFQDDPYGDDPGRGVPWNNELLNGTAEHTIVLNTETCVDYESYDSKWDGAGFSAQDGYVHNLRHPFNDQYANDAGIMTKSGIPLLGTLDVGEDAAAPSIDHIAYMLIPGSDASSVAAGGYVAPATAGADCVSQCENKLPFGARLRLNSSKYTCPEARTHPQAHKICIQLQRYGAIVMDHDGVDTYQIRLAPAADGSNPWNQSDVEVLNGIPITDWDVMQLGAVH
jgi:hypothetical protein